MEHSKQALQTGSRIDAEIGQLFDETGLIEPQVDGLGVILSLQEVIDGLDDQDAGAQASAGVVELAPCQQLLHQSTSLGLIATKIQKTSPNGLHIVQSLGIAEYVQEDWSQELYAVVPNAEESVGMYEKWFKK